MKLSRRAFQILQQGHNFRYSLLTNCLDYHIIETALTSALTYCDLSQYFLG
jgi:hypothetical protein